MSAMHAPRRLSRRVFLRLAAATAGALGLGGVDAVSRHVVMAGPLPPAASMARRLAKYVQPLPLPGAGIVVASPSAPGRYAFTQRAISRHLHPDLPATPLWAYDDGSGLGGQAGSFGMAIVAQTGTPLEVSFTHDLPETYPDWLPVDERLTPLGDKVRLMTHLHGGFVAADSDGSPAFTSHGFGRGDTQVVHYGNQAPQMPAAQLWFHDHGLGTTRLNVVAGLAAAYILRDQYDTGTEPNPIGVPGGAYEIPLVIQDRQFDADGTLRYPVTEIAGATWIGEYFGDVMLVNGKVWPYLDVEPRMYRLRVLNGCNARILDLDLGGVTFWQIGAEGGLFDKPVPLKQLVLAPAERADVLVDFRRFAGSRVQLKNHRPVKPVVTPAPSLEQVMQFRVGTTVSHPGPTAIPASLPGRAADLRDPVVTRYLTLNEIDIDEATWFLNINGLHFDDAVEESPATGTVEDWVFVNLTGDTHPMHLHLVTFQVVGRTPFDVQAYEEANEGAHGVPGGIDPTPWATGPMEPPAPEERGFKDTVKVNPGSFTTIRARFELPAGVSAPQDYVYHCHILEHEDNDMMRPFRVTAAS